MKSQDKSKAQKPYNTPELRLFGNLRDITRATGTTSKNADGGKGINNKT